MHDNLSPLLHEILPNSCTYIFQSVHIDQNCSACSATFFVNIHSQDGAKEWIENLQDKTKTTYRGAFTKGERILFKTIRHCQHKRKPAKRILKRPESIRNKKTECKSTLTLRLHNRAIMKKQTYQTHPCEINLTSN